MFLRERRGFLDENFLARCSRYIFGPCANTNPNDLCMQIYKRIIRSHLSTIEKTYDAAMADPVEFQDIPVMCRASGNGWSFDRECDNVISLISSSHSTTYPCIK